MERTFRFLLLFVIALKKKKNKSQKLVFINIFLKIEMRRKAQQSPNNFDLLIDSQKQTKTEKF